MNEVLAHPWAAWVIIALICGIFEVLIPSFSFVFATIAALPTALFALRYGWTVQLVAFSAMLVLSLAVIRPRLISRLQSSHSLPTRAEALKGLRGTVTEAIDSPVATGRVTVKGEDWAARSDESLAAGNTIVVAGSDGIVLNVKKV